MYENVFMNLLEGLLEIMEMCSVGVGLLVFEFIVLSCLIGDL